MKKRFYHKNSPFGVQLVANRERKLPLMNKTKQKNTHRVNSCYGKLIFLINFNKKRSN